MRAHADREVSRDKNMKSTANPTLKFTTPDSPGIEARAAPFKQQHKVGEKTANASLRMLNEGIAIRVDICDKLSGSSNSNLY